MGFRGRVPSDGFPLAKSAPHLRTSPVMTRTSIETAAKVYIVALICVFIWTVTKVLAQIGIF